MKTPCLAWIGLALLCTFAPAGAQNSPAKPADGDAKQDAAAGAVDAGNRELRPGDIIRYSLEEDPVRGKEFMAVTVTQLYDAHFPVSRGFEKLVIINVRSKKLAGVKESLVRELEEKYYKKASVDLSLYSTGDGAFGVLGPKVIVFGELSGSFAIREGEKLMCSEVVLRAGGGGTRTEWADLKRVKVHRKAVDGGKAETLTVDVDAVLRKNKQDEDVELKDGDRVEVKARGFKIGN